MKQILINKLSLPLNYSHSNVVAEVASKLHLTQGCIKDIQIRRAALICKEDSDAPYYDLSLTVTLKDETLCDRYKRKFSLVDEDELEYTPPTKSTKKRPIIVGSGPSGLFSALILARCGCSPIILERGLDVDSRCKKVASFKKNRVLDTECNIQFGEGGAGTFSDGKLKYGKINGKKLFILREFVSAGAPQSILTSSEAHIGTDVLQSVVKKIREEIINLGGEFHFSTKVDEVIIENNCAIGVVATKNGQTVEFLSDHIVLAIGHSARDTFSSLIDSKVTMEPKGFGIGMRIEHPQEYINKLSHGRHYSIYDLPPSSYHLVSHLKNGRSVYSFCMCPGGEVVPATSERGCVVTNGMSAQARDGRNANSAILVSVFPTDFPTDSPLGGFELQRQLERRAFCAGGKDYSAPVQRLEDFMVKRASTAFGDVLPTYLPGTTFTSHDEYLPSFITDSIREAMLDMDAWMHGFYYPDAILSGVETRSTSPVRILRRDDFTAVGIKGLYPCGEGAGYAGGIMSSAYDGILCAEAILNKET